MVCPLPRTGTDCSDFYASEVEGYRPFHITYIIVVLAVLIGVLIKDVLLFRSRIHAHNPSFQRTLEVLWTEKHRTVTLTYAFATIGALALAVRSVDPFGWQGLYPMVWISLLYHITTACIYSIFILAVRHITHTALFGAQHKAVEAFRKAMQQYGLFMWTQIIIWVPLVVVSALQYMVDPMYAYRAAKLFIGAGVLLALLVAEAYFGVKLVSALKYHHKKSTARARGTNNATPKSTTASGSSQDSLPHSAASSQDDVVSPAFVVHVEDTELAALDIDDDDEDAAPPAAGGGNGLAESPSTELAPGTNGAKEPRVSSSLMDLPARANALGPPQRSPSRTPSASPRQSPSHSPARTPTGSPMPSPRGSRRSRKSSMSLSISQMMNQKYRSKSGDGTDKDGGARNAPGSSGSRRPSVSGSTTPRPSTDEQQAKRKGPPPHVRVRRLLRWTIALDAVCASFQILLGAIAISNGYTVDHPGPTPTSIGDLFVEAVFDVLQIIALVLTMAFIDVRKR